MDMAKVSASQFKAKLGKYMQSVRSGGSVVITDRGIPVARLEPFELRSSGAQPARPADALPLPDVGAPPLGALKVKAISYRGPDSLSLLKADRRR